MRTIKQISFGIFICTWGILIEMRILIEMSLKEFILQLGAHGKELSCDSDLLLSASTFLLANIHKVLEGDHSHRTIQPSDFAEKLVSPLLDQLQ